METLPNLAGKASPTERTVYCTPHRDEGVQLEQPAPTHLATTQEAWGNDGLGWCAATGALGAPEGFTVRQ